MTFINENGQLFDPLSSNYEYLEIDVINKLLPPEAVVLELGGRLGIVSNYINQKLANPKNHVVVEPFGLYADTLLKNKQANNAQYNILNGAISDLPLFYDSEKKNDKARDNTVPCSTDTSNVTLFTYRDALKLLSEPNTAFTHVVVDCEGSFERFLKENFHFIFTWKWIFLELDCSDICDYSFVDRTLLAFNFTKQLVSPIHAVYTK